MLRIASFRPAANANAAPRQRVIRLCCDPTFPALSHLFPVFVVDNARNRIEIDAPEGRYYPATIPFSQLRDGSRGAPVCGAVLSCLITPDFDAVDLAETLAALRFEGQYLALSPAIPDLPLIRREVRASAPGLAFDVHMIRTADETRAASR